MENQTKNKITFEKWIMKYDGQYNIYGDLVNDIKSDEAFPKGGSYDTIMNHLTAMSAPNKVFRVFIEAWKKYRLEHGTKRMFFNVHVDLDEGPIFSDFVHETDMYRFITDMESNGHWVDVLADEDDGESTLYMVEVENIFSKDWYMHLDDMLISTRSDNVIQFPVK